MKHVQVWAFWTQAGMQIIHSTNFFSNTYINIGEAIIYLDTEHNYSMSKPCHFYRPTIFCSGIGQTGNISDILISGN